MSEPLFILAPALSDGRSSCRPQARPRDREQTEQALQQAVQRILAEGRRLTIAAVAREAGFTPALVHNTYPDVAEDIRSRMDRGASKPPETLATRLAAACASQKELRRQLAEARASLAKLASINQSLRERLATSSAAAGESTEP